MTSPRLERLASEAASPESTEQRARAKAALNAIREANALIGSLTIAAEFGHQENTLDVEVLTRLMGRLRSAMRPILGHLEPTEDKVLKAPGAIYLVHTIAHSTNGVVAQWYEFKNAR